MEDEHVALDRVSGHEDWSFYAVYDGHGGWEAADMARELLDKAVFDEPALAQGRVEDALASAFARVNAEILCVSEAEKWDAGTTAVCVLCRGAEAYCANVGDSEAILARLDARLEVSPLSIKHNVDNIEEAKRVMAAGGRLLGPYVRHPSSDIGLAVTRSLGDIGFTAGKAKTREDLVIATPHVESLELDPPGHFLLLASDGLWDALSYEEAARICDEARGAGKSPEEAAWSLVRAALDRGSRDNVTCVVVYLLWDGP